MGAEKELTNFVGKITMMIIVKMIRELIMETLHNNSDIIYMLMCKYSFLKFERTSNQHKKHDASIGRVTAKFCTNRMLLLLYNS